MKMLGDDRLALQSNLKKLQGVAIANLTRSTWRSRSMTEQFRAIERIKDLFQGLETAYEEIARAATPHDVDVAKGRIFFAIDGMKQSAADFPSIEKSAQSLEQFLTDKSGPVFSRDLPPFKPSGQGRAVVVRRCPGAPGVLMSIASPA